LYLDIPVKTALYMNQNINLITETVENNGNLEEAINNILASLKTPHAFRQFINLLSEVIFKDERYKPAIEVLYSKMPDNLDVLQARVNAYSLDHPIPYIKVLEEAVMVLDQFHSHHSKIPEYYVIIGREYNSLNKFHKAIPPLTLAIKHYHSAKDNPEIFTSALSFRAHAYLKTHQQALAEVDILLLAQIKPNNGPTKRLLKELRPRLAN
jgi:tetratricopeptide (TPR) repeat protein